MFDASSRRIHVLIALRNGCAIEVLPGISRSRGVPCDGHDKCSWRAGRNWSVSGRTCSCWRRICPGAEGMASLR